MKVREIVRHKAKICYGDTSLAEAAAIMLEHDYGVLPVVESMAGKLCGVITDRDICMGALTQGLPLENIPVRQCCSRDIHVATLDDDINVVHELMRKFHIRRVPVVNDDQRVVGLVSTDDLSMHACISEDRYNRISLTETLASVCGPNVAEAAES
jgi:CBS domain-containing protein